MATDDYRPRLAFRVGVTGHRDLHLKSGHDLQSRIRARLEQIKHMAQQAATESQGCYDDDAPAILRAISPLAEGADRIFAREALDLGYELECPLPFKCHEYQDDFESEDSKRKFNELLGQAAAVFELEGSRGDKAAAYKAVGYMVLDQCDILLAIWDGKPAKGADRTADVVAKAKRRIPVVWLHADSDEPDMILTPDGREDAITCPGIDERLKVVVWRLLLPPLDPDPTGPLHTAEWLLALLLVPVWRAFEKVVTVGLLRSKRPADDPPGSPAQFAFQTRYAHWDKSANLLAGLYRGAFLLNYMLGVFAVFLAIIANAVKGLWPWPPVCESILISIVIILMLFMRGRRWHLRTADCRYLAEQFRILCYSYPLGFAPSKPHLPAHYLHAEFGGWLTWHTQTIVRLTPMPTAKVTDVYLERHSKAMRKWLRGQIHYHDRNAVKLELIERRLIGLCWWLISFALVGALAACIWHPADPHGDPERWLLFLTAGLPAASAAAHAISTQGEFRRLVDRSESMARRLRSSLRDLEREVGSSAANLRRQTEDLAQAFLDEVADWQSCIANRPRLPASALRS